MSSRRGPLRLAKAILLVFLGLACGVAAAFCLHQALTGLQGEGGEEMTALMLLCGGLLLAAAGALAVVGSKRFRRWRRHRGRGRRTA